MPTFAVLPNQMKISRKLLTNWSNERCCTVSLFSYLTSQNFDITHEYRNDVNKYQGLDKGKGKM